MFRLRLDGLHDGRSCPGYDTAVFVTVVGQKKAKPGQSFFPLTVNYQERTYAAGRIPGSFFRREGRPSEGETLTSRLIDRPIRPLFPDSFLNEVQVIATVVSLNPQVNPDFVAMIGASAALSLSGIPFNGPIGAARVGYINDQYVLNPTADELKTSRLDLVVAGTQGAVLMVESEAEVLSEDQMLGAVVFGHEQQQIVIDNINSLVAEAGKPKWDWQPEVVNAELHARVAALSESRLGDAYLITEKQERSTRLTSSNLTLFRLCKLKTKLWTLAKSLTFWAASRRTWFVAVFCVASHVSMAAKKT